MLAPRSRAWHLAAASAVAAGVLFPTTAAFATENGQCPTASPSDVTCNPTSTAATDTSGSGVAGTRVQERPGQGGGGLPLTGADIAGLVAIGTGALVTGGLLVGRSRRHA